MIFALVRRNTAKATLLGVSLAGLLTLGLACNQTTNAPDTGGADGTTDGAGDGGGGEGGSGEGNTLLNDASGFNGTLSGKVVDLQTTRASTVNRSTAQEVPTDIETEDTTVAFLDVAGDVLVDTEGEAIPPVPLELDATFTADGLPVGVDFTVCVDIGTDGTCELKSCVNIANADPSEPGTGRLDNVQVDPLTTIILAKLQALVRERGLDPAQLPISPVALVTRIVAAYTHLFEETGIDDELTLEDIEALSEDQLAALFDTAVPAIAQSGMQVARGNLRLAKAADVNAAALAAAEVFLQAGFPIADGPDPTDLSSLADLPNVEATTLRELFEQGNPLMDDFAEVDEDLALAPAQFVGAPAEPTIYISTVAEPDRNFSDDESDVEATRRPHLPVIHDYLLLQMARLQMEERTITISALHELLTSLDTGIGARLTYFIFDPNFFGPPLTMFETADGAGKGVNLDDLFGRIAAGGFRQLDHEQLQAREQQFRSVLRELLSETMAPTLERMAGGFMSERITSVEDLASRIRDARAHLPFGRTGPSTFFVVADGDSFRSAAAVSPVTVDAQVSSDGTVSSVTYNASGEGKFYLMFTEGTEGEAIVGLLVREAGRPLHGRRGPLRLNMHDQGIFASVNGEPFIEFVSETGSFFPGINVSIVSSTFVPVATERPTTDDSPATVVTAEEGARGPNQQIFVLATAAGPDGEPVRVDYDAATGVAAYNDAGRFLLQFLPDTQETGQFLLFNEQTGRPAGQEDPANFFVPPPPRPPVEEGQGSGDTQPAPPEDSPTDPAPIDGTFNAAGLMLVSFDAIVGLPISRRTFTHVFGTEVPNPRYNADGDPFFDDINGNGAQDADEPTAPFLPMLFNRGDWRSTDIRLYYRRSDNNAGVTFEEVDFGSETPRTLGRVVLVPRNFLPRLNAFRFGRPNTALNLLTAFLPPEFFDGTHALTGDTPLSILGAVAVINLMMDQVHNVQAVVDVDGTGPLPTRSVLVDAHMFVAPVGDPFVLLLRGFSDRSVPRRGSSAMD